MFEEIKEMLGLDSSPFDMTITFVMSKGAVIQGYKKILKIEPEKIVVLGKNKRIVDVAGKFMQIVSLAPSEIVVHGRILYVGEHEEK